MAIVAEETVRRASISPVSRARSRRRSSKARRGARRRLLPGHDPVTKFRSPVQYGLPRLSPRSSLPRQLVALTTYSESGGGEARERMLADAHAVGTSDDPIPLHEGGTGIAAYADAVATYLAFAISRCADFWCTIATWSSQPKNELVVHAFGRQAIPMTWDFGEICPFSESNGNFYGNIGFVSKVLDISVPAAGVGTVFSIDAAANSFPVAPVCFADRSTIL